MKTKEQCYNEATLKELSNANGTRQDVVYTAMELYAEAKLRGKVNEFVRLLDEYWTFNNLEEHTHSYHTKQDFLDKLKKIK